MQDKELEKILQEKADSIKMRDFTQVWNEIKGEINRPEKNKKVWWKKWFPMTLASAVFVLCVALSPIIIKAFNPIMPPEEVYYTDELNVQAVLREEMLDGLVQSEIIHANLSIYQLENCKLLTTEDNVIKGASFTIYNNTTTFFGEMQIYDKTVDLPINTEAYDTFDKVNSTNVYYKLNQQNGGIYEYSIYAVNNDVQYVMEYTGFSDNLTEFLDNFFA